MNYAPLSESAIAIEVFLGSHPHAFPRLLVGGQPSFICVVVLYPARSPSEIAQTPGTESSHTHQYLSVAQPHLASGRRLLPPTILFVLCSRVCQDPSHSR